MFVNLDKQKFIPDLVIYNPSSRVRGPIGELNPNEVKKALEITSFGGFLVAQEAAKKNDEKRKWEYLFYRRYGWR